MTPLIALLLAGLTPAHSDLQPLAVPLNQEGVQVFAYLDAEELKPGGEYEFVVAVTLPEGRGASESGSPAPFLQLDVPKGVKLLERELKSHKELSDNEFLQLPYERLLEGTEVSIPFTVSADLAPDASIGLNILAYVDATKDKPGYFFRRRLELPLKPGAEALPGKAGKSDWGTDEKLLQIGQKAAPFLLPNAKGELVSSESFIGKQNLIVSTYRAHW